MAKTYVFDILLFVIGTTAAIFLIAACASEYWVGAHGMAFVPVSNGTSAPVVLPTTTAQSTTGVTTTNATIATSTQVPTTGQETTTGQKTTTGQETTTLASTTTVGSTTQPATNGPTNKIEDETFRPSGSSGGIVNLKAYFTRGLWNRCTRYEDPLAKKYRLGDDCKWYSNKAINAIRAMYILGFIAMAVAVLASYVLFCKSSNVIGYIAFGSYVVTVFFIVLALSLYAKYEKNSLYKWKWGYALAWFGVVLEIFSLVVMCVARAVFNAYEELH